MDKESNRNSIVVVQRSALPSAQPPGAEGSPLEECRQSPQELLRDVSKYEGS
jgi:hypothetical protein